MLPVLRKSLVVSRTGLFALALLVLSACNARLYVSEASGPVGRLAVQLGQTSFRKHGCYPATISLLDQAGLPRTTSSTLTIAVQSNASAQWYETQSGCLLEEDLSQRSTFVIPAGADRVIGYVRALAVGTVSLGAQISSSGVAAAPSSVPVTFSTFNPARGPSGKIASLALDNSKTYVAGDFVNWDDRYVAYLARLNADGKLDTSFVPTGTGLDAAVTAVAVQSDGRVLVAGWFNNYNGVPRSRIARLNTDGSLDTSFASTGTGLSSTVSAMVVQPDGKIVVGGTFNNYNGTPRSYAARLNTDGTLDTSFALAGTGFNNSVEGLALQPDGKIVCVGWFTSYNGTARNYVARLNANGTLDTGFVPTGTGLSAATFAVAVQADGAVLVGGSFVTYNGTARRYVARLTSAGALDATFVPAGTGLNSQVRTFSIQGDGRILIGGWFSQYNGTSRPYIARLNTDGTLDTNFAPQGTGVNYNVWSMVLLPDGRIRIGGEFTGVNSVSRSYVAQLDNTGALDTLFSIEGAGLGAPANQLALQTDGRVMVGGNFSSYSGVPRPYITRVLANGSIDTSFATLGTGLSAKVRAVKVQSDGQILVGGDFTTYNGVGRGRIARLTSNGALDYMFAPSGTGLDNYVTSLAIQSNGRIVVGGVFANYNGTARPSVLRLNSDGTLDTSFVQTGTGLNSSLTCLAVQSDGRILVGGPFTSYNGTTRRYVARLNSDGSLDSSFALTGTGLDGYINSLAIQNDGRIVIGGSFTSYNGTARMGIARLNADGSLDTSFAPTGTGLDLPIVSSVVVQSDGHILVGGGFTSYNSTPRGGIVRLNADGSLDETFAPTGTGFDGSVQTIEVSSNGSIFVGGTFTRYATFTAPFFNRLTYRGALD